MSAKWRPVNLASTTLPGGLSPTSPDEGGSGQEAVSESVSPSKRERGRGKGRGLGKGKKCESIGQSVVVSTSCYDALNEDAQGSGAAHKQLQKEGWLEFKAGWPWEWELIDFVEELHSRYALAVAAELESLRAVWMPAVKSKESVRPGSFAAMKVSERFRNEGLAVFPGPSCQEESSPYAFTAPRFYVSVTQAAIAHFKNGAPAIPDGLASLLWPHADDRQGLHRARGLGWALAPPGCEPQQLHSDIWGGEKDERTNRVRFPHLLWKRTGGGRAPACCTTEIVPGAFTKGDTCGYYSRIARVSAAAVIVDGEVLHRGAATRPAASETTTAHDWVSTCTIELCSPTGWGAWKRGTGGESPPDINAKEWRMLCINRPATLSAAARPEANGAKNERDLARREHLLEEQAAWERDWYDH